MSDINIYGKDENAIEKSDVNVNAGNKDISDILGKNLSLNRNYKRIKKKLPVVTDIIIGVLILVLVAGLAIGAYFAFRHYANDFGELQVEYSFLVTNKDDIYNTLRNRELYMDTDENAQYFGRVSSVYTVENEEIGSATILTVKVPVRHKNGSGYLIGENRIGVGCEYALRSESLVMQGTVVELTVLSNGNGGK